MDLPASYLARIRAAYPALDIAQLDFNTDGLTNDVVIVNGDLVCRFARSEWGREHLAHEARVLDLVRSRVHVPVPAYEHLDDGFAAYRFLPGEPLTRDGSCDFHSPSARKYSASWPPSCATCTPSP